jgi:hypothetical protein
MAAKWLSFLNLSERHPGISEGIAMSYSEAVRVCLGRHHTSPVEILVNDNGQTERVGAEWPPPDERIKKAWANKDDATRDGAYGLSLAAVEAMRGLVAVRRAETRTGADYYLAASGGEADDLEASFRLEVSGTDEGGETIILGRLRQKLDQARKGNSNLPAIASVVGFAALQIVSADVDLAPEES